MLNPEKLRYLGIDLHSRTRRRVLVVATWLAFLVGMEALNVVLSLVPWFGVHPMAALGLGMAAVALFSFGSVFRDGGAVRRFQMPIWCMRGHKGEGFVMLRDLDDWARYKFGAKLADLPEAEQQQVLRTYRVGYYWFPAGRSRTPERLDERELAVRNEASVTTLRWVGLLCFSFAGTFGARMRPIGSGEVGITLLMLGCCAFNGPRSVILWNEPDPRINGDLALVAGPGSEDPGHS